MTDTTDPKTPRGKLTVAREWLDTGGIVRADAIVMTGLANTLEVALDENDRLRAEAAAKFDGIESARKLGDWLYENYPTSEPDIAVAALDTLVRLREVIAEARVQVDACRSVVAEHLVTPDAVAVLDLVVRGLDPILAKAVQS